MQVPAMIDVPEIVETHPQDLATLHQVVPRHGIQQIMGPGIQEVMGVVAAQGQKPVGPWLTHHLRMDPDVFDFEICVPVSRPITPAGRVQPGRRPHAKVARTVYHGSYEGIGAAWGEFQRWIRDNHHTPAADIWEVYLKGPESSASAADWQTELIQPIAD
jgi:effector-binding domain-containing protein